MGQLSFPAPKSKGSQYFGRKPRTLKEGEVKTQMFDVYRIIAATKYHVRVYTNYNDLDDALKAKNDLQTKTGDTCYVVGHTTTRMKKVGTRK